MCVIKNGKKWEVPVSRRGGWKLDLGRLIELVILIASVVVSVTALHYKTVGKLEAANSTLAGSCALIGQAVDTISDNVEDLGNRVGKLEDKQNRLSGDLQFYLGGESVRNNPESRKD